MNNVDYLIKKIKNKKDPILWHQNKYYYPEDLLKSLNFWRKKIRQKKIKPSSLIAFKDNFNIDSIAFFIASLKENLILVSLPINQYNLIKTIPCNYFADIKKLKIGKINNKKIPIINNILPNFQKKKKSGLIIFSSGSSGKPKAILHNFSLLINKFKKKRKGFKTLLMLNFDHIGGINTLLGCLINLDGVAISISTKKTNEVCKVIEKTKAELLPTTPTFLNMLLFSERYKVNNLSSLKLITFGTEPMPNSLLKKLKKIFPKIYFKQTYGLSEIGIMRTKNKNNGSLYVKVGGEDYKIKIVNNYLYVKSKTNMVGYLNESQPFDKNGWMNTGDKVLKEKNGYIKILGRDSDLINIGGEKTFPQEIEEVILKNYYVLDTRVYSENHEMLGTYIIADVILKQKYKKKIVESNVLREHCKRYLPKFKVPSKFVIKDYNQIVNIRLKKIRNKNIVYEKNSYR